MQAAKLVGVEYAHHIGMAERGGGLCLALEALNGRRVAGQRWREQFERDDPLEQAMPGLEDHPHAPGTKLVEHHVVADQKTSRLALQHGGGLVGCQSSISHQLSGQCRGVARAAPRQNLLSERLDLRGFDQAVLNQLASEFAEVVNRDRSTGAQSLRDSRT